MKCRECSQEIEFHQTYFEVNGQSHIRFHHVCFLYLKPRRLMALTGSMMPATIMRNDKDDNKYIDNNVECHDSLCDYQEPHDHGFACGDNCPCGLQMSKG